MRHETEPNLDLDAIEKAAWETFSGDAMFGVFMPLIEIIRRQQVEIERLKVENAKTIKVLNYSGMK